MIGNNGTNGTRNPLGRSGCFLRSRITPNDTSTNAKSVPMFDKSAASPMSTSPAGSPTTKPAIQVDQCGVLNRVCTAENNFGSSPSRDIANQMRVCPYWNTSSDDSIPISAPMMITAWNSLLVPSVASAYATGASDALATSVDFTCTPAVVANWVMRS